MGPGEKLVLMTKDCRALFVWRKFKLQAEHSDGVNCAVFRNEGTVLSSVLIEEAVQIAWRKWPNERLYTYVKADAIKSTNPGCCFKKAGFKVCGITKKRGYIILERLPSDVL